MIIVNDNPVMLIPGAADVYNSLEDAAFHLEVYDIGDPRIHVFSSDGIVYELEKDRVDPNKVCFQASESLRLSSDQIRSFALQFLSRRDFATASDLKSLSELSLADLYDLAFRSQSFQRQKEDPFARLKRSFSFAKAETEQEFTPNEVLLLEAVIQQFEPGHRQSVRKQLLKSLAVQRSAFITYVFFQDDFTPDIAPDGAFKEELYRVRFEADGARSFANVVFFGGRIHRIETRLRNKHLKKINLKVLDVKKGNPKLSRAYALYRLKQKRCICLD